MLRCKLADTPMDYTSKLGTVKGSTNIRLDIVFLVSVVSQFMNNLTKEHIKVVYRILRYLKMTLGKELYFKST